jgi:predicted regulator of Ras-like GTPase activity (Roadblock/LC7/MglB family)
MSSFEDGYNTFSSVIAAKLSADAGELSAEYVDGIRKSIDSLFSNMKDVAINNDGTISKQSTDILKGFAAEQWHADTFNLSVAADKNHAGLMNAILPNNSPDSHARVIPPGGVSAQADIQIDHGNGTLTDVGSKYYKTGADSAKAQAKSHLEHSNGVDIGTPNPHAPVYAGQERLIPTDQMTEARDWLNRKINESASNRPEQVARYRDTLDKLTDQIKNSKGSESIPLTEAEAKELARLIRDSELDINEIKNNPALKGLKEILEYDSLVSAKTILKDSLQAGIDAALISTLLKVAPEIVRLIEELIETGEIDKKQFEKIGFAAVQGGTEGFIRGAVASTVTSLCKGGFLGEVAKNVDPSHVAAVVVIVMSLAENSYRVAAGEITQYELVQMTTKQLFVTISAMTLGGVAQAYLPILPAIGYLLGSLVGSVTASFLFDVGESVFISFCVNNGFTFFGLVGQDYKLPNEVIENIGAEIFEVQGFNADVFENEPMAMDTFTFDTFEPKRIELTVLRRGVIQVGRVGYQ